MLQLMRRAWLGLLFGGGLSLLWGRMLRSEAPTARTAFSATTGLLVGLLSASIRLPGPPFVGGALVGLVVSVPYAVASHVHTSLAGGAFFGGVIAWAVNLGRRDR